MGEPRLRVSCVALAYQAAGPETMSSWASSLSTAHAPLLIRYPVQWAPPNIRLAIKHRTRIRHHRRSDSVSGDCHQNSQHQHHEHSQGHTPPTRDLHHVSPNTVFRSPASILSCSCNLIPVRRLRSPTFVWSDAFLRVAAKPFLGDLIRLVASCTSSLDLVCV